MSVFIGVDEAGRGPLAGPVVAAAVVLREGQAIAGVTDSKKLTARKRDELYEVVCSEASHFCIASASAREIDELNILQATLLAMRRAIVGLEMSTGQLTAIRIDGNRSPELPPHLAPYAETVVRGDASCPAIGAASILAKVTRDRQMRELDKCYPAYGFAAHKGYPTAAHIAALHEHGITPEHRMSFRPVREAAA